MDGVQRPCILLIDDNNDFREDMRQSFGDGYDIKFAPNKEKALEYVKRDFPWRLILLDLDLDGTGNLDNGLGLIKPLIQERKNVPIIIVTNDNHPETVLYAMKEGAVDFLFKLKYDADSWKKTFDLHLKKKPLVQESPSSAPVVLQENADSFLSNSPAILQIKEDLIGLSHQPHITVLLTGETGVGKEVAARHLHQFGARKDKPFVPVHIASIPQTLLEASLFGYQAGAFTDAKTAMKGLFEQANGGVLFLDEIGEINQDFQVKLLRFLEDKIIRPLGSSKEIKLDIHIVAATNRNLKKEVEAGTFRRDLYQRLSAYPIELPPLRNRYGDVALLLEHYLHKENESMNSLTEAVKFKLLNYSYPGNVRELVGFVQRMCLKKLMRRMPFIDETILPDEVKSIEIQSQMTGTANPERKSNLEAESALVVLRGIENALKKGKKLDAAESLGWNLDKLRNTIVNYYKNYSDLFYEFPTIMEKYKNFLR